MPVYTVFWFRAAEARCVEQLLVLFASRSGPSAQWQCRGGTAWPLVPRSRTPLERPTLGSVRIFLNHF